MRTGVYVDGFNLYYGALKGTGHKWLDLRAMVQRVLAPTNQIVFLKYFTAMVRPTDADPSVAMRQQNYLRAIKAHDPLIEVIYGRFFEVDASISVTKNGRTYMVHGRKSVEKGTDVSLAVHFGERCLAESLRCGSHRQQRYRSRRRSPTRSTSTLLKNCRIDRTFAEQAEGWAAAANVT
jgi:hypothetical protein